MNKSVSTIFIKNLNKRMGELNFTAVKVSASCNLSRNTINSLREGKAKMVKFSTIAELCKALYVHPSYFFKEDQ
ncbi:helix-turn-helix domain-containing protein [Limosilactobacillus pontis]|uniref:helix-turn-helix domain-containing protein n=1 Tax=Limosilactobacillus pontis TaxID=35787 RepID=UPI0039BEFBB8